ncbi:1-deoxy-D-xylulose-5-phosphate reductoisomerase [Marivibrio halodurans]|uniref:1-deoxy-D-xylulose 5-phosphate reductoisomerase n=1 Tax=Marivibrio halodurans TaxID=2039722 RepID=A0A8J7RW36_9PROT|nr:1-deoxy-D-xylulose-5-phosphate reductoisomerase [Marivibrio halodurans]MBP5855460.1 1-deoxy-D-xylulose-5-phosphate reductoisomerase [Marivibrio halodurans]
MAVRTIGANEANGTVAARPGTEGSPRAVTVLGATGSVGRSTMDLIADAPDRFRVEALTAHRNVEGLADLARRFGARFAALGDPSGYGALKAALSGTGCEVAAGPDAVVEAARRDADWVMAGIVGAAGLPATLAAVERGALVAFANKECLVSAGSLMMERVAARGATLLPVDSEHNAIFQVFEEANRAAIDRLILTASGGPFRDHTRDQMRGMRPEQAVAHPNWSMGAKISVDSATMMNKGLEVIEAHYLFDMPSERIEVLVHPQSVVHSMVAYSDGSFLAQLGAPDMRIPIAHALAWPRRIRTASPVLDLSAIARLDFSPPDESRFPALRLAREALDAGPAAPPVMNAANEVAVAAFLAGRIGFLDIVAVVEATLEHFDAPVPDSVSAVIALDGEARAEAESHVARIGGGTRPAESTR